MDRFIESLTPTTDYNQAATTRTIRTQATASGVLAARPKKNDEAVRLKAFYDELARRGWHRKRVLNRTILSDLGYADERRYLS